MAANNPFDPVEVLDATIKDPSIDVPPLEKPETTAFNPDKEREGARKGITYWLLTLLTLLFAISFLALSFLEKPPTFAEIKSLIELLLGPLVALVSAATGFYFGAQSASKEGGKA